MKKLLSLILILAMVPVIACADSKLSKYSLEELYSFREMLCEEILSRSEWKSVEVPIGFYVIGEDIPAGHWTIKYSDKVPYAIVMYFTKTTETGRTPDFLNGSYYQANIGAPGNAYESFGTRPEADIELKAGYFLTVDYGPVIFEPYTGRNSPFFTEVIP